MNTINPTTHPYPDNLLYDIFGGEWEFPRPADFDGSLEYVLHSLTERERRVLDFRYKNGLTFEEIGKHFCVTRERVRQIYARALRKLCNPQRLNYLKYGVSGVIARQTESAREAALASLPKTDKPEDITLEELELSVRSYNCLKRAGKCTLRDVSEMTFGELCHVRYIGKKSVNEICAVLAEYGVSLKPDGDRRAELDKLKR